MGVYESASGRVCVRLVRVRVCMQVCMYVGVRVCACACVRVRACGGVGVECGSERSIGRAV